MAEASWISKQFKFRSMFLTFKYLCNIIWDGGKILKVVFTNAIPGPFKRAFMFYLEPILIMGTMNIF